MRKLMRAGITCFAVVAWLTLVLTPPAWAHAILLSTAPSDGALLAQSPLQVSATFNQPLITAGDAFVVLDPRHEPVPLGPVHVSGPTIWVTLQPNQGAGTYHAAFRVVSQDGHPVEFGFSFSVRTRSAVQAVPEPQDGFSATGAAPVRQGLLAIVIIGTITVIALIAVLTTWHWSARRKRRSPDELDNHDIDH